MTAMLTGRDLTLKQVVQIARGREQLALSEAAGRAVSDCWRHLQELMAAGYPIYGLTTGFGALDGRPVAAADNRDQQMNLLRSHAAGVGEAMRDDAVRAMMV